MHGKLSNLKKSKAAYLRSVFLAGLSAWLPITSSAWARTVLGDLPLDKNPNVALSLPQESSSAPHDLTLSRAQYVIQWNPTTRLLRWAAWKLSAEDIGSSGRRDHFEVDADLESVGLPAGQEPVQPTDYSGSCIDRGHQVPSGDRTSDAQVNQATFYMSNIIPQSPWLNRGTWKDLETETRKMVQSQGRKAFIFAGPIFKGRVDSLGPQHNIPIPSANFKIVVTMPAHDSEQLPKTSWKVIAAIFPNTNSDGSAVHPQGQQTCADAQLRDLGLSGMVQQHEDWHRYLTTVDEVERQSGLNILGPANSALRGWLRGKLPDQGQVNKPIGQN